MEELATGVLEFITMQLGRVAVWLVSFGRWRGEQLRGNEGGTYGPAGALSFVRDGRRVITDTGLLFFGIAFYLVLFVAVVFILGSL